MLFLENIVPDGYYVVLRGAPQPTPPSPLSYVDKWKDDTLIYGSGISLYHLLKNQGFADLDSFNRERTWIFTYRKNRQSIFPPKTTFSDGIYDRITMNVDIKTPDSTSTLMSPAFGPAMSWKKMYWRGNTLPDVLPGDSVFLDIVGVAANGQETTLLTGIKPDVPELDISTISEASYPFLKLKMTSIDTINYTPFQLKNWRITYVPVPEGALAPNEYLSTKDTVDIGEPINFKVAFKNILQANF